MKKTASKSGSKGKGDAGIGDDAVLKATGKRQAQWFQILDKAGAKDLSHKEIAAWLCEHHAAIGGWWCQMLTVAYERARGKRAVNQTTAGFQISASRTLGVPVSRIYAAWTQDKLRAKWLPKITFTVTKANRDKSLRILWKDAKTRVQVYFVPKGKAKSQVSVQHVHLPTAAAAKRMKAFWNERMDRMSAVLVDQP